MYQYEEKAMNKDDIMRMAREALLPSCHLTHPKALERFAALVAAAERDFRWTQSHWTEYELSIVAAEREVSTLERKSSGGRHVRA